MGMPCGWLLATIRALPQPSCHHVRQGCQTLSAAFTVWLCGTCAQDFPLLEPPPQLPDKCSPAEMRPSSQFGGTFFDLLEVGLGADMKPGQGHTARGPSVKACHTSCSSLSLKSTLCGRGLRGKWGNLALLRMVAMHDYSMA